MKFNHWKIHQDIKSSLLSCTPYMRWMSNKEMVSPLFPTLLLPSPPFPSSSSYPSYSSFLLPTPLLRLSSSSSSSPASSSVSPPPFFFSSFGIENSLQNKISWKLFLWNPNFWEKTLSSCLVPSACKYIRIQAEKFVIVENILPVCLQRLYSWLCLGVNLNAKLTRRFVSCEGSVLTGNQSWLVTVTKTWIFA